MADPSEPVGDALDSVIQQHSNKRAHKSTKSKSKRSSKLPQEPLHDEEKQQLFDQEREVGSNASVDSSDNANAKSDDAADVDVDLDKQRSALQSTVNDMPDKMDDRCDEH